MKKSDVLGLVSLIVVLGGVAALFAFAPERLEVAFQPIEVEGSALVLIEAGELGVVVDAVLGKPGFITLHDTIGDAPSTILASSDLLDEGIHSAITLAVSGGLDPLLNYVMLMVADDGDGVYEPGVDRPVMVNGEVIRVPVELTPNESSSTK
ncbi:MAG: hypothetical protein AAB448_05430 [Patescibacteria group bacterium]